MKRNARTLAVRAETVRMLRAMDLAEVCAGRRGTVSEQGGGGPCPGDYSWNCKP